MTLAVTVRTVQSSPEPSFVEETNTLVVNAHGALLILSAKVRVGQELLLANRATQREQLCRVATIGQTSAAKTQIGVEFLKPSRDFWQISFPPEDWVVPESLATADES